MIGEEKINLVFRVPREGDARHGLLPYKFGCGRRTSEYFLFDERLRGLPAERVKIFRNKKNTAWIVKPGGEHAIIVIKGRGMSRGRWAPELHPFDVYKVFKVQGSVVLTEMHWRSRGGGLWCDLFVVAVPAELVGTHTPIACVDQAITSEEIEFFTLYLDGTLEMGCFDPEKYEVGHSLEEWMELVDRAAEAYKNNFRHVRSLFFVMKAYHILRDWQELREEYEDIMKKLKKEEPDAVDKFNKLLDKLGELAKKYDELLEKYQESYWKDKWEEHIITKYELL